MGPRHLARHAPLRPATPRHAPPHVANPTLQSLAPTPLLCSVAGYMFRLSFRLRSVSVMALLRDSVAEFSVGWDCRSRLSDARAMPAEHCRVRLPEVEPSLGASVRPGFKAPCREYCDAFFAEKKIFHHGKIIVDPLL